MTELFDVKDLLTVATTEQAVIGAKGFFGDNLIHLNTDVRQGKVETLTDVTPDVTYCFESNNDLHYMFFLPLDKIKNKEPVYRPIKTIDELFNFLMPKDTDRKAELLFGKVYQLKHKSTGDVCYKSFYSINLSEDAVLINGLDLEYLFDKYEIKKNGKWVPFGIKEE